MAKSVGTVEKGKRDRSTFPSGHSGGITRAVSSGGRSIASRYRMKRKNVTPQVVENERRKREGREAWNSAGILAAEEPEVEDPS